VDREWSGEEGPAPGPPFCPKVVYHKKKFTLNLCYCNDIASWSLAVIGRMTEVESDNYRYIMEISKPPSKLPSTSFMTPVLSYQLSKESIYERSWIIPERQMSHYALGDCVACLFVGSKKNPFPSFLCLNSKNINNF
jgi:hypothetical protein